MPSRYAGPGRVRPCLAWRIDGPDGSVTYRGTRAEARMILQRVKDACAFLAKRRAEANAGPDRSEEVTAATRRMLGMAPATDAEAIEGDADADGNE